MRRAFLLPSLACTLALAACQPQGDTSPDAAPRTTSDTPAPQAATTAAATQAEAAPAPAASGSARGTVLAAGERFLTARSYHATIATDMGARNFTMDVDYVAPDRYRMTMPMGTQTIIGDTMHMQVQGRTMTAPVPAGTTDQWRDPNKLQANAAGMQAESLGSDAVDGRPATKYRITHQDPALKPSLLWIGAEGYPVRVEADGEFQGQASKTVITYSRFNDASIKIDAP